MSQDALTEKWPEEENDLPNSWLFRHPCVDEADILHGPFYPLPNDVTILSLIERQAERNPDYCALIHGDTVLSFAELDGKANRLAERLRELREDIRNTLVPIICENGLNFPIALLAILKAGGAFVPVDPEWPKTRLTSILNVLQPPMALLDQAAAHTIEVAFPTLTVAYGQLQAQQNFPNRLPDFQEDLIYGFFTSGSTGTPKCCLNLHRGVFNRFQCMTRRFGNRPEDVVLQNSKHIFDSSIWQLLWPLTNGHTVVIPYREGLLDLDATIDIIDRHKVTMADFVPTIFNLMVEIVKARPERLARLGSLRRLLIGGEEISAKAVQEFRRLLPHVKITNTYGPTEASIGMVFHEVDDTDSETIPLGLPIDNTFLFIANEKLEPLPRGEVGEMVIGGECLGAGYLGEPEKTAESFPPNPYANLSVHRLYRTGDLGFINDRGDLQFAGRMDYQVKVDGVRVELGEVEKALLTCESVREAKVVANEDSDGRIQLIAFVAVTSSIDPTELRAGLGKRLPPSFVPRRVIILKEMPLTPNGKINRQQLLVMLQNPEPKDKARAKVPKERTGTESIILLSMREIFDCANIGPNDDFFDLGGDSLQATKLSLILAGCLKRDITAGYIYQHPNARAMARQLEQESTDTSPSDSTLLRQDMAAGAKLPVVIETTHAPQEPPREMLLTGATGFIGAHLLAEMLNSTSARIHCLVRATGLEMATARLFNTLRDYDLPTDALGKRVVALPADLTKPGLGLEQTYHDALAQDIDTIVHNGALVDFLLDYSALRKANVLGTLELLKLARTGPAKWFHHVSTLSVFGNDPDNGQVRESDDVSPDKIPSDAYSKTKFVCEILVRQAQRTGSPTQIYRLGEIMPSTVSGYGNPRALLLCLVKAATLLGLYPDVEIAFDYTPVNIVSRALVAGICQRCPKAQSYHVFNPHHTTFKNLMGHLHNLGVPVRLTSYAEFWSVLNEECANGSPTRDLLALLSVIPRPIKGHDYIQRTDNVLARFANPAMRYSCDQAAHLLAEANICWPKLGTELLAPLSTRLQTQLANTCC